MATNNLPSLCLALMCLVSASTQIIVPRSDPYENLIVEIKPGLTDCGDVLQSLQAILESAAYSLTAQTGNLTFKQATVVIPEHMANECEMPFHYETWEEVPDVQRLTVGEDHPVFGANPWTQQTGDCGKPGDLLYLPKTYLTSSALVVSKSNLFLAEWAKYRWGVFEEHGTEGDPVYPLEYMVPSSTLTEEKWLPNYCVDHPLLGHTASGCNHPNCAFEMEPNQTATSSLLSLSSVSSIINYCNNSTHDGTIPTKQNARCDGQSVMDIYLQHPDNLLRPMPDASFAMEKVLLTNNTAKKFVLLVDQSGVMNDTTMMDRWTMLTASLKHWIMADVPDDSQVGIVMFTTSINVITNMTLIEGDDSRNGIVNDIPHNPSGSPGKNVAEALRYVTITMKLKDATILLIVEPNHMSSSDTPVNMIYAAGSNAVWPLIFPAAFNSPHRSWDFQKLASETHGKMLLVDDKTYKSEFKLHQSVQIQRTLVQHMRQVQKETMVRSPHSTPVVIEERHIPSAADSFQFSTGTNVDSQKAVKLMIYSHNAPWLVTIDGDIATNPTVTLTSYVVTIPPGERTTHDVNITFAVTDEPHLVEVLVMETEEGTTATLWSSHDLSFVDLSNSNDPVTLFTKVKSGDLPVVGAEVFVSIQGGGYTDTLQLRDNGGGPDITGNDGIYSAFWTKAPNTTKMIYEIHLHVRSTDETYAIGGKETDAGVVCCGSSLNLETIPKNHVDVSIDQKVGTSYVVNDANLLDAFPPAKVTDLKAFIDYRGISLYFTAPGEDLDRGSALEYRVWWRRTGESEWQQVTSTEYEVVKGGLQANVAFPPPCYDDLIELCVTARDVRLQESPISNIVRIIHSSSLQPSGPPSSSCPSCTGGIAGAFFGGLFGGWILLVIGYFGGKKLGYIDKTKSNQSSNSATPLSSTANVQGRTPMGHFNSTINESSVDEVDVTSNRRAGNAPNPRISSPLPNTLVVTSSARETYFEEREC